MITIISILAGAITIFGAVFWLYKKKQALIRLAVAFKPFRKAIGIRYLHLNRKETLRRLLPSLKDSKLIRVMNLKGYSVVEEADIPDTLLYQLLSEAKAQSRCEILMHFPDSVAFQRRQEELGSEYSASSMRAEQDACVKKIATIAEKFPNVIELRFFQESVALWNMIIWDKGLLLGWYDPLTPSHRGTCLELDRKSILGRQFEKYFNSVWESRSVSARLHDVVRPIFPTSAAYPMNIVSNEKFFLEYYGRSPSQENAFVIMVGGGAGTGKSTLAWQLADSFGVRNVISTDMIRQVLRQGNGTPDVLKAETWEAWRFIGEEKNADTLYEGLKTQAALLIPTIVSLAKYALSKGMPTIIEGIHLLPINEICSFAAQNKCVLFFVDSSEGRIDKNFELRKYSTHMREIRNSFSSLEDRIQLHERMLKRARQANLTVVQGDDWMTLLKQARQIVVDRLGADVK